MRSVQTRIISVLLTFVASSWATSGAANPYIEYKRALVDYYGSLGYHPLLVPEDHQVGDVIDIGTLAVLKPREECFPDLEVPEPTSVDLPRAHLLQDRAASFWVKVKSIFGVELSADDTRQVLLNIESPVVRAVSLNSLRNSLSEACPELQVLFVGNQFSEVFGRRAVVVSAVLEGEVRTVFSYGGAAQASAKVEDLAELLGLPLGQLETLAPELSADLNLSGRLNLRAGDGQIRTLAYRPSTIFRPRLGATASLEVEPFDADKSAHLERLQLLARAWAEVDGQVEDQEATGERIEEDNE